MKRLIIASSVLALCAGNAFAQTNSTSGSTRATGSTSGTLPSAQQPAGTKPAQPAVPASPASPTSPGAVVNPPAGSAAGNVSGSVGVTTSTTAASANAATFTSMDTNGDGQLTKAEGKSIKGLSRQMRKLDTDQSGSLSAAEFAAFEIEEKKTDKKPMENKPANKNAPMDNNMGIDR